MKNKKIHFVCSGNVFRSRLAEAYMRRAVGDSYIVSSSGVNADRWPIDYVSPWAHRISHRDKISNYLSSVRKISSQADFDENDIIIFMHPRVLNDARAKFTLNEDKCLVWDVKDREDWRGKLTIRQKEDRTARLIKRRTKRLIDDISRGSWVDIVTPQNQSREFSLPISIANNKNLWHRGCHVVLTTPNKHVVIQRRSPQIIFSPRMIDITMGGHVDSGESPKAAMLREMHEEMGISLEPNKLKLLEIYKQSRYHPKYKRHARSFTYTYHAELNENHPVFNIQKSEVSKVALLSPAQSRHLVAKHRLRGLGKLNYTYAFYRYLLGEVGV